MEYKFKKYRNEIFLLYITAIVLDLREKSIMSKTFI